MQDWTRRRFLGTSGAAAAAPIILAAAEGKAAPSERIRHAVIGVGGMGRNHLRTFLGIDICEVAAVCDVDPENRAEAVKISEGKAKPFDDFRRVLEDASIQTVSIATPDHWHTPIALAAIAAGKHVYVEKPCSHNVRESILLAEAAAKTKKCVQHGTQYRGGEGPQAAVQFLREGKLGKVRMAKALNNQLRPPIGREPDSEPPAGVNYDMWLGPAPKRPFSKNRWHYNWHWHWDTGTGDMGNDGVHQIDVARWGLGAGWPKAVSAMGGQLFYDDDHETPDTQVVTFDCGDCYLLYEMRLWSNYTIEGHENAVFFYGEGGTMEIGRDGCHVTLIGQPRTKLGGTHDLPRHARNFLECARAGTPEKLFAPISEGAISSGYVHLGNVATRLGRGLKFNAEKGEITGDAEATKLMTREYRKGYELTKV